MALKHYYVEDVSVDPLREDRMRPVRSVQFEESIANPDEVIIITGEPSHKTSEVYYHAVKIPIEELKNAYEWLKKKAE